MGPFARKIQKLFLDQGGPILLVFHWHILVPIYRYTPKTKINVLDLCHKISHCQIFVEIWSFNSWSLVQGWFVNLFKNLLIRPVPLGGPLMMYVRST